MANTGDAHEAYGFRNRTCTTRCSRTWSRCWPPATSTAILPGGGFDGYEPLIVEIVKFFKTGKPPDSKHQHAVLAAGLSELAPTVDRKAR
jgi:hypothetical protein